MRFKHSDIQESKVFITDYKPGGYSLLERKDLPTAAVYNQLTTLGNGFGGFDGLAMAQAQLA